MNRRTISPDDGSFHICNCGFAISVNVDAVLWFFIIFCAVLRFSGLLKLSNIRELNRTRRQRKREPFLKMLLGGSAIISQLFKVITLAKCVLTILELNWNQRFRGKRTKLNICHHMLTSFTQLQNRSFHVMESTRRSARCPRMKNARAKRAKLLFSLSNMQICDVLVIIFPTPALRSLSW